MMTTAYWELGREIVEHEQKGLTKADYGEQLVENLSKDLTKRFGRGFGKSNLFQMRGFYLAYSSIFQTPSGKSSIGSTQLIAQTAHHGAEDQREGQEMSKSCPAC